MSAPDVFSPGRLGPVTLRNRTIKAATYEGLSHRGRVTQDLIDFHVAYARGGVGMTTVAYLAVDRDGRTDRHQVLWTDEAMPGLRALTDAVHAEGAAVSAQIGHGGPVAEPRGNRAPALAPSARYNVIAMNRSQEATVADLDRIVAAHGRAAARAVEAGFDAVEVHLGHNYLASAFLSPKLNHREDGYGGGLRNRARLAREIMRAVRDAVGDRIAIVAKMNMDDGAPGGFWLDEAIPVAQWLEADGTLDALEMTSGSSLLNPMYLFKGDVPLDEFAGVMPQPVKAGVKLIGHRLLKSYPYSDGFLLEDAKQIRAAVDLPMILLGGVTSRAVMDTAMAEGFGFVAMARALLREPDLVHRMQADADRTSLCIHCNKCMPTNYTGTRCVLVDRRTTRSASWGKPEGYAGTPAEPSGEWDASHRAG
ncbi:NADH:flavin oxidoreductase [Pimelobacter simplex]|uniref:NADH:flavin oxidoreductase, Old Yellow Enzyme family n=1 Tax=Nocardioides simplex TaxID=2045 RepID=A0A0C5XCP5_NOCSI|nr:NADH:flavin oxidoreductase [Pimelobacter simplex]AJR18564.1 NADH:flavin oxidoreductase, Old Yellow Enzyme family CasH [Pimelobacter simplex]MCG8153541.1 NADH:flavin oxidoreductase [Pimelobacter simplex]GEB15794.1 NADH:flavin oxidoreductase [Pimelobacter simplex]SFN10944.1 2,4-dienoyl-CoA reductase [Pimelobacter simplex]